MSPPDVSRPSDSEATLLARLLELSVEDREEFLRRACAADAALARRLAGIVQRQDVAGVVVASREPAGAGFPIQPELRAAAIRALEAAVHSRDAETPGSRIGPYKLLQKIGEGGFGVVWMAEQDEPIKRRVALKVVKVGMDTEEVIARFEAERQALALMTHPNIAQVFDAGSTEGGRPYFVMELVRGVAITRYSDENRLPAEARLRLFITVCQAVQHAHHKGVIHRDLKPSNILVTLHDGTPVPKIIDFGIAKATQGRLTEKTLVTQFHAFIGTPAYTSPEQMEMSGLDVDTRSDIYSLGVLLYELLTGQPPFDSEALLKSGLEAMRRTIRETDPPRPSQRLRTLDDITRTSVARQRGTDAAKLSLRLRGDLDWIAMRCLEKDRTRRYNSAAGLATDIERHLSDNPVEARPPSRIYRTKKFIRRHTFGVLAAAGVAASLIAGLIASSTLFVRERSAHGRATSAEKKETDLRLQAELDRTHEVKRAARTALDLANRNLADGRVADGLAYLVYAARKDPKNTVLGPRLASALATHNFLLPEDSAFECGSRVLAVRFTKDGQSIYVGTEDGTFRVLDTASGRLRQEFHLGRPVMLGGWEFARDNDTAFAARFADNTIGVFDVATGKARWAPFALDAMVWKHGESLALGHGAGISPDGRWLYGLGHFRFWIWDAATGAILLQPEFDSKEGIGGCDFTTDGSQLAVTVGGRVQLWTLPDARPIATPLALRDRANTTTLPVRFSPDGRRIAVSIFTSDITILDPATGALIWKLSAPGDYINGPSVVFASNSRVFGAGSRASGSWDLTSGEFRSLPVGLGADVISASFDATGRRILVTGADGFARLCDLDSGELVAEPAWRQTRVFCADLAPDGAHVVIATATGTVQRLRVGRGAARPLVIPRETSLLIAAPFLAEAPSRLLWWKKREARVIDVASGLETAGGFAYPAPLFLGPWGYSDRSWPLRADGRIAVVRTPQGWQAWELGANGVTRATPLEDSEDAAGPMRFSPQGNLVALRERNLPGKTGKLMVWSLHTGKLAGPPITFPADLSDPTPNFSPDGNRLAFGTADGTCMIVEVATARTVVTFATRALVPNIAVWFSPDGTRVFTSNLRNETRVWNATTGEPISRVLDTEYPWGSARYLPDGRHFATWGVHTTSLWDGRTGAAVGETIPAGGRAICFSHDSRNLGTADDSGITQVWDVPSGHPFTEPMRHNLAEPGRFGIPEFSPDARFLRAHRQHEYSIWSVPPRLPEGTPVPEWLLQLATVLATKIVNDAGQLVDLPNAMAQFHDVRRQIQALPAGAPLDAWGRWVLNDRPDRPIAPGFTCTPAQAAKLATTLAADLAPQP